MSPFFYQYFILDQFEGLSYTSFRWKWMCKWYHSKNDLWGGKCSTVHRRVHCEKSITKVQACQEKRMNYKLYMSYMGMKQSKLKNLRSGQQVFIVEGLYTSTTMHFNFCQLSSSYRLRSHMHIDKTRDMEDTFREQVSTVLHPRKQTFYYARSTCCPRLYSDASEHEPWWLLRHVTQLKQSKSTLICIFL